MTLLELQFNFARLLGKFLTWCFDNGYKITMGECYRPPEVASLYAKQGRGIEKSLHTDRLAVDLNLFKDGKYMTRTEDYRPLGEYWERLSTGDIKCCWGGRFKDGNHFSVSYGGKK